VRALQKGPAIRDGHQVQGGYRREAALNGKPIRSLEMCPCSHNWQPKWWSLPDLWWGRLETNP
jgi:hypothetical protein